MDHVIVLSLRLQLLSLVVLCSRMIPEDKHQSKLFCRGNTFCWIDTLSPVSSNLVLLQRLLASWPINLTVNFGAHTPSAALLALSSS